MKNGFLIGGQVLEITKRPAGKREIATVVIAKPANEKGFREGAKVECWRGADCKVGDIVEAEGTLQLGDYEGKFYTKLRSAGVQVLARASDRNAAEAERPAVAAGDGVAAWNAGARLAEDGGIPF